MLKLQNGTKTISVGVILVDILVFLTCEVLVKNSKFVSLYVINEQA